ncbi:MAG: hypothetical protein SGARI_000563 [Bacillariaceae sp.]
MLCAEDDFQDTCAGDSGGPLFMQEWNDFVQVGITSWGYGCGDNDFPGVYSRVSHQYHWIRMNVCENSIDPPDSFECDAPTLPPAQDIEVTIAIQFDDFPGEITFFLIDDTEYGATVMEHGEGSFAENEAASTVSFTVPLKERSTYTFKIDDSGGDGLCCYQPGSFAVYVGTEGEQGEVLASGEGNFGATSVHQFTIGEGGVGNEISNNGISGEGNESNGNEGEQGNETEATKAPDTAVPETEGTSSPTAAPTSMAPSASPTAAPSASPSISPMPTKSPTKSPTPAPTPSPTTRAPSEAPTILPPVKNTSQRNQIIYGVAIVMVVAAMFLATSWYADRHNRIDSMPDDSPLVKSDDTEPGDEEFGEDPLR